MNSRLRGDAVKFKIERIGGAQSMQRVSESCSNCCTDVKSRKRDFSEQAWSVLVLWHEIQKTVVDQPICEDCYNELREVLIDRATEIEVALKESGTKRPAAAAAATRSQVGRRKAG
jgi:hypothetical protein